MFYSMCIHVAHRHFYLISYLKKHKNNSNNILTNFIDL